MIVTEHHLIDLVMVQLGLEARELLHHGWHLLELVGGLGRRELELQLVDFHLQPRGVCVVKGAAGRELAPRLRPEASRVSMPTSGDAGLWQLRTISGG